MNVRHRVFWAIVACSVICITQSTAQDWELGLRFESATHPDIEATGSVDGAPGEEVEFTAVMTIGSVVAPGKEGAQGWSCSLRHTEALVDSVSVEGTVAALEAEGGLLNPDASFFQFEIAPPERNEGLQGIVQVVILNFLTRVTLPVNTRVDVGKVRYRATIDDPGRTALFLYEDGLRNEGRPLMNVVTVAGRTADLRLGRRELAIGAGPAPEAGDACSDGIDNDSDGMRDCDDPGCRRAASCASEDCADGVDNDEDGLVDCADIDCVAIGPCPDLEVCTDGIDNDDDGDADCRDADCSRHPTCLPDEVCDNGIDDDGNGFTDCEDRSCSGVGDCPVAEICDDGIDNDGDGDFDCQDSFCERNLRCFGGEQCTNGIDDDGDSLIDCEDTECSITFVCRTPEDCENGRDDDMDGFIDCNDTECFTVARCGGVERCTDGADNDDDGDVDCADSDCRQHPACRVRENCGNLIDDDEDGFADCDDSDCFGIGGCPAPERCNDGIDNDLDGLVDCEDPNCATVARCRGRERCDDRLDNDVDGFVDCDDLDCFDDPACPAREDCDNGVDDDTDGLADCDDPGCASLAPCDADSNGFDLVLHAEGAVRQGDGGDGGGAGLEGGPPRNVVYVESEEELTLEVITYVVPFPEPQESGAQGWSISVRHDRGALDLLGPPTLEGTDAEQLFSGGFEQNETASEDGAGRLRGEGGGAGGEEEEDGYISAVVLSFGQPLTLDPTIAQSIARATYLLEEVPSVEKAAPAVIEFRDGLRGTGQPVSINLTIDGAAVQPIHRVPLELRRVPPSDPFVRGDANGDAKVNLADAIWILNELVRDGPPTPCHAAADANDDSIYDFSDPIFIVQYRFLHGPSPVAPFPTCGKELVPSVLGCPVGSVARCP